ncbi:MAG: hypothetical protein WDW38_010645 [Sanguina aurantia]
MAPAQKAWRDEVRSAFRGMTAAVAQLAHVSLPHPSLLQQLPRLHTLRPEFRRAFHSRRLQYDPVFCRTQYWQLVQQLARLGARLSHATPPSVGTYEEDLFWELWQYPAAASRAFKAVTNRGLPLGTAPAGNANNTAPEHRQATTYRDAVHVDRKLFRGVLCYPLASLMLLVNNLHTHQQSSAQGSIGRCFFFTSPSILALFKMMLLLPERRLVGSPTELNDSLDVLCGLLELQAAQNEATEHLDRGDAETRPGHVQDYAVPDPPPHLAQPFADRALETDVRVLRVLSSDTRGR